MLVAIIVSKTVRNVLLWNQLEVKSLYRKDGVYFVNVERSVTEDMKSEQQTLLSMSVYMQNGEIIWKIAFQNLQVYFTFENSLIGIWLLTNTVFEIGFCFKILLAFEH